jgi:hypothetical protein
VNVSEQGGEMFEVLIRWGGVPRIAAKKKDFERAVAEATGRLKSYR